MKLTPNFKLSSSSYSVMQFPSGEIQITLDTAPHAARIYPVTITGSILSSDNVMELLLLVESINHHWNTSSINLVMPYCAYSRQDRRCNQGESFSLKVFTSLINSCNFTKVTTFDNHSDVSTALLNNCYNISVWQLLLDAQYTIKLKEYDYFISPDAGANKKVFACSQQFNIPMIRADKIRDVSNGKILDTQVFATADQLKGKTVLIIDDIAANGMTFWQLAKTIKEIEPTCKVDLFVTHGFFHSNLDKLSEYIDHFITTTSVCTITDKRLTLI